jgi:hypothetical protein
MNYHSLQQECDYLGLCCRGGFHVTDDDDGKYAQLPASAKTLIMIGNIGSALWATAGEYLRHSTRRHPLDHWTRSHLGQLAAKVSAHIIYPFDGPPFAPFQRWAVRCEAVAPSPIGPLIHPDYGLWHAYRAALVFDTELELPDKEDAASPCDACLDKPCTNSCPVGALGMHRYDVPVCSAHLATPGNRCMAHSCLARLACPVGRQYVYSIEMGQFHMGKFLDSISSC